MSNSKRKKENPNLEKTKKSIEGSELFNSNSESVQSLDELKKETKPKNKSNTGNDTDNNQGTKNSSNDTIKLKKKDKPKLIQRAYYLKPEQVHMIDRISEETELDKSHLVRRAIDEFLKRVEY